MTAGFGWRSFTCLCLLVGAMLRFCCIGDVEYKDDEDQMFRYSQAVPATGLWPVLGATSGVREIRHPVLGVWSFAILAQVFRLETPAALTRSVQALSVLALGLLFWFAWRAAPAAERETWLWTAALASVSLVAVVYARKLWAPNLLPIFCVTLLIGWSRRDTPIGALVWGVAGALLGQIHMAGFAYAAALAAVTALLARTGVRWRAWLAGSAWGAIPVLPWLVYLWFNEPAPAEPGSTVSRPLGIIEFFRMAWEISLSQTAEFNLGDHFAAYLAYPLVFGVATHGVGAARVGLHAFGLVAVAAAAVATLAQLGRLARGGRLSDVHLCLMSAALTGVTLALAGAPNAPHHHLMLFPLEYVWLPAAALAWLPKPRIWLSGVWLASAVCSVAFLQFVHDHCGAPRGDYGIAARCSARTASPALEALIRAGQEDVVARMLGRGETLPAGCTLTEGEIDRAVVRAVYACGAERVGLELMHPSKAPDAGLRTEKFAGKVVEGSPPAELLAALAARVRSEEAGFTWLLEAGRQTSRPVADVGPYGYYLPVLTSREVLLRMVGGAAVLLVLTPWWAAGARPPDGRGGRDRR